MWMIWEFSLGWIDAANLFKMEYFWCLHMNGSCSTVECRLLFISINGTVCMFCPYFSKIVRVSEVIEIYVWVYGWFNN